MDIWKFSLHWGWNPVIFFVILIASFALVLVAKKRVLWLVPALVIYTGLDWALPMSWLFKLVFWLIGVLVVVLTAIFPGPTKLAKFSLAWMTALVAIILVLGGFNWVFTVDNDDSPSASAIDSTPAVTETPDATPTETESAASVDCPAGFAQQDITDQELNRFIKGGIDAETPAKSRNKFLEAVRHDASSLLFYARTFGLKDLPSETETLSADGTCLSEAGQQVHHDLAVLMKASGVQFGDAPSNAYNSGVNNEGLPVIDTAPGISGEKKALKVKLPDGSMVIILVRCGNPVFPSPPQGVPPGPTDNPECTHNCHPQPPCTHNCNPTPNCPPGWYGTPPNCLQPKDPSQDPGPQGNAPQGGGHNDTNGPGSPNPSPTFPSTPHTNPPAPSPTPTQPSTPPPPPATGAPDPSHAPSTCVPAPGDSC